MTTLPIRIYVLAKQLNLPSETLESVGQRLGFEINGLSMLSPAQHAAIEKAVRDQPLQKPPAGGSQFRPLTACSDQQVELLEQNPQLLYIGTLFALIRVWAARLPLWPSSPNP